MKNYTFCPISDRRINEWVARLNGIFTVLILTSFLITHSTPILIFLLVDFSLRAFKLSQFSPICMLSKQTVRQLEIKGSKINEGPKIFAARIGLLFMITISILHFSGNSLSAPVAGILAVFSFLEGAFGFCVACVIYPYVYKLTYKLKYSI